MSDFPELDPTGFRDRLDDLVHAVSGSAPDESVKQFWWDTGPELPKRWDGSAWVTGAANKAGDTFTGTVNISGAGVHPDLGDDFALEGAAPSNYPAGFTTFRDVQGSFPAGASGIVETYNPLGTANRRQFNWNGGSNTIYTRVATDSTAWEPWLRVNHVPAAYMFLGADQSLSTDTTTKIALDTTEYDRGGITDLANNRMVLESGLWIVTTTIHYDGGSGDLRMCRIERAATRAAEDRRPPAGTGWTFTSVAIIIDAADGDAIELLGRQDSGGALTVIQGTNRTQMQAFFLEEKP